MCHVALCFSLFFFNDTATTEIYTLSLHDALPIAPADRLRAAACVVGTVDAVGDAPAARTRYAPAVVAAAGCGPAAGAVRGVGGERMAGTQASKGFISAPTQRQAYFRSEERRVGK